MSAFADRFIDATERYGPLCVGIDPHAGRIPELFGGDTPVGLVNWGQAIVRAAAGRTGIVKPQAALFERHGWEGMRALSQVCETAKEAGLIVLMDAKRGDIGSTAAGYASAYLEADAPFVCDALTVNPYMGVDTIEPYVNVAERTGKGVIVLTRTSNPGAQHFQLQPLNGQPLYMRVAEALSGLTDRLRGRSNWSGLMMVVGATGPDELRAIRTAAPDNLFLVPGYGTQGAGAKDAVAGFVDGQGGCVNASRSVNFPEGHDHCGSVGDWEVLVSQAIGVAQRDLIQAGSAVDSTV